MLSKDMFEAKHLTSAFNRSTKKRRNKGRLYYSSMRT